MKAALALAYFLGCASLGAQPIQLTPAQAEEIGKKIWRNECGQSVEKLTWWKKGEQWASLGIGHFIWYPENFNGIYTQTFPDLIQFLASNNVQLPAWLQRGMRCPWKSEEEFFKDFSSTKMQELRTLLHTTMDVQMRFILQRFEQTLPQLLTHASPEKRTHIEHQFKRMVTNPMGIYPLIDYVNFKGEGTNPKERYNNQGWGLLHVLERMQGTDEGKKTVQEFAQCAQDLLTLRVKNSPQERNEAQWLKGWHNRIATYCN